MLARQPEVRTRMAMLLMHATHIPLRGWPARALLAGMAACCVAHPALGQPRPDATPRSLRVMTYNIKHGQTNAVCTQPPPAPGPPSADCNLDLAAAMEVVREHAPDIVGLQEVDRFWARSGHRDEPAELGAGTGLEHRCYAANLDHGPDSHSKLPHQYGTVILSRFPILECGNTLLPRTGDHEQRGLTRALIDVRGLPLQVFNAHLHTTSDDRLLQTAEIGRALDVAPRGPKILLGDFNARPGDAELNPLLARLQDAWSKSAGAAAGNPSGLTSPALPSEPPRNRIDYIFVSLDIEVLRAYVPADARTRLASDHLPVVSELRLPEAR
jgi:endonuclease/exonuclease/phosphatase family metal-dependent hydrolase